MDTNDFNNRKYTLIEEIIRLESVVIIEKIEKLIHKENQLKKSPLSYVVEELKQEVAEAEKEIVLYSQDEVRAKDHFSANRNRLDYPQKGEQKIGDIPEAHQSLVMERFRKSRENPDRLMQWEEAKKKLNSR